MEKKEWVPIISILKYADANGYEVSLNYDFIKGLISGTFLQLTQPEIAKKIQNFYLFLDEKELMAEFDKWEKKGE